MIVGLRDSEVEEVEKMKKGKLGGKKAEIVQKKRAGEGNLCNLNQW